MVQYEKTPPILPEKGNATNLAPSRSKNTYAEVAEKAKEAGRGE